MFEIMPFESNKRRAVFNPFREMDEWEKAFFGKNELAEFKTDIREDGDHYVLEGDYRTITASRNCNKEEKDEKNNYVRRERSYGSFARSFDVSGIKTEDISVEYNDGVLKLNLPKREAEKPSSRRLELK